MSKATFSLERSYLYPFPCFFVVKPQNVVMDRQPSTFANRRAMARARTPMLDGWGGRAAHRPSNKLGSTGADFCHCAISLDDSGNIRYSKLGNGFSTQTMGSKKVSPHRQLQVQTTRPYTLSSPFRPKPRRGNC